MNLRKWIPGFAALPDRSLADLQADVTRLMAANAELAKQLDAVSKERDNLDRQLINERHASYEMMDALTAIQALCAPSKNGTARKAGRMAREALE